MIQARQGQTTGNSRWRAILLGAATMLLGQVATAELSLRMELAQTMLHRFERIHMIVTVSNMGSRVIMLDPQRREGNGYLDFDVRQMDENMPRMVALSPVPASGAIAPGTSRRFLIDLAQV
ncbi:MAG: hypothetical protein O3B24_06095, partial [Verrucomicrobia bacterium]|nr:hypothetical protein [Verrucomicrobiota bacterium]